MSVTVPSNAKPAAPSAQPPAAPQAAAPTPDTERLPRWWLNPRTRLAVGGALVAVCLVALAWAGQVIYRQIDAHVRWRKAHEAIANYDLEAARTHLLRCVEVWPDDGETHFLLARTCRRLGDFETARDHLQEAKRLHWVPQQVQLEYLLGQAQVGLVQEATPALRRLLGEGHADRKLILEALAIGSLQSNFVTEARIWTQLWREGDDSDWLAWYWDGRVLEAGENDEGAADDYEKVVGLNPDFFEGRLRLAGAQLKIRHFPDALKNFQVCREKEPDNQRMLLGLARCQHALGMTEPDDTPTARLTLDRLFELNPRDVEGLMLRGQMELENRNNEEGIRWLLKALDVEPSNRLVTQNLARAYQVARQPEKAKEFERRARELDALFRELDETIQEVLNNSKEPGPRCHVARILMKVDQPQQAFRWLVGAWMLDPRREATKEAILACLPLMKNPELEEKYRRILTAPPEDDEAGETP
jgi:tetratricopeptide (TPR) repeat protein